MIMPVIFQSTLPVGGATYESQDEYLIDNISIHAPRGGSDLRTWAKSPFIRLFQSTLPVGGATLRLYVSIINW